MRTDQHAPKSFDPAEYEEVGCFDNHHEDGFCSMDPGYTDREGFAGNYEKRGRCDHCGAGPLRYGVIFHHVPTDQLVVVGLACAGKLAMSSLTQLQLKKKGAALVVARKRAAWTEENPAEAAYLSDLDRTGRDHFLNSLERQLHSKGFLSEKQTACITRMIAKEAEWAARKAEEAQGAQPFPIGRVTVEGEIVNIKEKEGFDGNPSYKWLVKTDDGNKVYGSVPTHILDDARWARSDQRFTEGELVTYREHLIGKRVRFAANFEVSKDDDHFGFYKRPTKAEVIA